MIDKKEKKGGVTIYYVKKDYDDNKLSKVMNIQMMVNCYYVLEKIN